MEDFSSVDEDFFENLANSEYNLIHNIWGSSPPSLQCIILTSLVIEPWKDVLSNLVKNISFCGDGSLDLRSLSDIESKVFKRISTSMSPDFIIKDLKRVTHRMGQEIRRAFNDVASKLGYNHRSIKVVIYFENLTWTQQGTIDYARTAARVIDLPNLSISDKFIFTSEYCLEEKIQSVLPRFENCNKYYNKVVAYWTGLINDATFCKELETTSYLSLCEDFYDVKECEDPLVEFALMLDYFPFMNKEMLLLDLLTKTTQTQLDEICIKMGPFVVKAFHDSSEWHELFIPAVKYVLQQIKKMKIDDALSVAIFCWDVKAFDLKTYENIWFEIGNIFRQDFENNFYNICLRTVNKLSNTETIYAPTIKLLLSKASSTNFEVLWPLFVLPPDSASCIILDLIRPGKFDILNTLISEAASGNEEDERYVREYIVGNSSFICSRLVYHNNGKWVDEYDYKILNEFLNRFYTLEERDRFCKELPYKDQPSNVSEIFWFPHGSELPALDYFLDWCFKGDREEVAKCKAVIFDLESESYTLKSLFFSKIETGRWEGAGDFLMWLLCANYNVATWEQKLIHIKEMLSCQEKIEQIGLNCPQLLATYCFDEEVDELKKVLDGK